MTTTRLHRFLGLACLAMLGACATDKYDNNTASNWEDLRRSGAEPVTHHALEQVNLIELLDPKGLAKQAYERERDGRKGWDRLTYSVRYDLVFAGFSTRADEATPEERRNLAQNRLLAASERRCGRFFQFLKKDNSDVNFQFAVGSSVLATAGALVPGIRAAQNLSGLSALVSGVRAEYNNEYYANLAVSVITKAIDEKRKELRIQLQAAQAQPYARYDIAAAVADGVRYDASCNIANGLEQANEALQRLNEPGRDAINRALLKDRLARALASGDVKAMDEFNKLAAALNIEASSLLVGGMPLAAGDAVLRGGAGPAYDATRGTDVVAAAAQSFGRTERTLKVLEDDLVGVIGDKATPAATATLTTALKSLRSALGTQFSDKEGATAFGCFADAKAIAETLTRTRNAALQAKAMGADERSTADALEDARRATVGLVAKLDRYERAVGEVATKASGDLRKKFSAEKPDFDAGVKAVAGELGFEKVEAGIGAARLCSAKPKKT
ncbi:hypothetical protein NU688_23690 [Variovorax sp. ZS18.2.2]|uniref:hypothetical protein n=1 Tax=Variovorax sp. ZS18.2.2 TaxID=2971255 RepID=UPI002150BB0F|nr:hypothetical protein [Variovorax sp. ZS18.2.2]MCR6479180.1 hypothetical protein [Variovorax sp. ZS18.2.2]